MSVSDLRGCQSVLARFVSFFRRFTLPMDSSRLISRDVLFLQRVQDKFRGQERVYEFVTKKISRSSCHCHSKCKTSFSYPSANALFYSEDDASVLRSVGSRERSLYTRFKKSRQKNTSGCDCAAVYCAASINSASEIFYCFIQQDREKMPREIKEDDSVIAVERTLSALGYRLLQNGYRSQQRDRIQSVL